jgi:hypothetical protein
VNHLRLCGAIAVNESEAGAARIPAEEERRGGDGEAVRRCVETHLSVLAELAAPIVAVEGAEGLRLRLERVIEEAAPRFPELLAGLDVGPSGTPDPRAVLERALRFPGDREREVALAFGELISYVEFELVNHPKIEEPELFLEAIEQLRARL